MNLIMNWKKMKMNNYQKFILLLQNYLKENLAISDDNIEELSKRFLSDMKNASLDDSNNNYLYNGDKKLSVIKMDDFTDCYRQIKSNQIKNDTIEKENNINAVDAFLINKDNIWFLIEFKDAEIKSGKSKIKHNIIRKAYGNWYMLLDILYNMKDKNFMDNFDYENPIEFAKNNVVYILVCSGENNSQIQRFVSDAKSEKRYYTPPFMNKLKWYLFKDAYVYTELYFEKEFVNKFKYE